MKKRKSSKGLRKWHKWTGLIFAFFMLMFASSGILLNHRKSISSLDVPRSILGKAYSYDNWNRGTVKSSFKLSADSILLYGSNGIWLTDTFHLEFSPFVNGIRHGADNNIVNNIVRTNAGEIFAVTTFDLYRLHLPSCKWINISQTALPRERLSDIAVQNDSLILMSRSHLYASVPPYTNFNKIELPAPEGYEKEASLFRTMWTLHSGELFGFIGKLVVDILGVFVIILCITGIVLTFFPNIIRRKKKKGKNTKGNTAFFRGSLKWHNKIGVWLFPLLLILVVSGTFLRPPLLISIIRSKSKPIPGTILDSNNPWHDKLRCLQYANDEWLLYSLSGFYYTNRLDTEPQKLKNAPPVSVMGVNVLHKQDSSNWVVGSFSGIYLWDRQSGESRNYYTGEVYKPQRGGMPTFGSAVAGYSDDFPDKTLVFEYGGGVKVMQPAKEFAPMPDVFKRARMSLWHLSLEVHVGRIYTFMPSIVSGMFIFISGILSTLILLTGFIVYHRRHKKKRRK